MLNLCIVLGELERVILPEDCIILGFVFFNKVLFNFEILRIQIRMFRVVVEANPVTFSVWEIGPQEYIGAIFLALRSSLGEAMIAMIAETHGRKHKITSRQFFCSDGLRDCLNCVAIILLDISLNNMPAIGRIEME